MKKIAFMFAVAAVFAACGNEPKTATQEQKDSILNELKAEAVAASNEIKPVYEGCENAEDSAAAVAKAEELKAAAIAAADTTDADFKAKYEAAVKAFEDQLNAPAEENKEGEQKEEEQK